MTEKEFNESNYQEWQVEQRKSRGGSFLLALIFISLSYFSLVNNWSHIWSILFILMSVLSLIVIRASFDLSKKSYLNEIHRKLKSESIKKNAIQKNQNNRMEEIRKEKQEKLKQQKEHEEKLALIEIRLKSKFRAIDRIGSDILELRKIRLPDISDFNNLIVENEKAIYEKGGDDLIAAMVKIDTFLSDFHAQLSKDKREIIRLFNADQLKNVIRKHESNLDFGKINDRLIDMTSTMDGKMGVGFDAKVDRLITSGSKVLFTFEKDIETLKFYKIMALVMILFYLEDKKIRYFEIYGAFEKMGVFDNSWQKQVLQILGNIDDRLANIGSQLSHLSDDFEILFDKSDLIISELKQIENGVFGNNILQAVTAYQTWQINKNTKSKN
jgi:hypothetical protein